MDRAEYEARIGRTIRGKWTLERLLGCGGMAAVYAARHKIGRLEAIKMLHPEIGVSKEVRTRFEQEAYAVNSIGHRGVVEIRDVDVDGDGVPFMVMELLEGETLADKIERRERLELDRLLGLCDELLDVLVACHGKGIVHRDIKPDNLFIQDDGTLKVLDFGIARVREGVVNTVAGTTLGTMAFMPQEQIKGVGVDHRADLFAVGATLFNAYTLRHLCDDAAGQALVLRMLTTPAPRLSSVAPDAPPELALFVDRALAFLPEHRYPDALVMRGDLRFVRRGELPPYAVACNESGKDPSAKEPHHEPSRPDAPKKSTEPQLPVFPAAGTPHKPPSTEPQLPAFPEGGQPVKSEPLELPRTDPQLPAFPAVERRQPTAREPSAPDVAEKPEPKIDAGASGTEPGMGPTKHVRTLKGMAQAPDMRRAGAEPRPREAAAVPDQAAPGEPAQDEPARDERADEPADEPAQDEPAQDEPAQDEPAQDEPAQDEAGEPALVAVPAVKPLDPPRGSMARWVALLALLIAAGWVAAWQLGYVRTSGGHAAPPARTR